jgi:hypothetical protein
MTGKPNNSQEKAQRQPRPRGRAQKENVPPLDEVVTTEVAPAMDVDQHNVTVPMAEENEQVCTLTFNLIRGPTEICCIHLTGHPLARSDGRQV